MGQMLTADELVRVIQEAHRLRVQQLRLTPDGALDLAFHMTAYHVAPSEPIRVPSGDPYDDPDLFAHIPGGAG